MTLVSRFIAFAITLSFVTNASMADDSGEGVLDISSLAEPGTISSDEGLAAWERIHDVFTHPRCLNCHVGKDSIPLWSTRDSDSAQAHGMRIQGGDSRIGAETLLCSSCHQVSLRPNTVPHAAPHTGMVWRLAPIEFQWTDKNSVEICEQVRAPQTNGGRDEAALIEHILHDARVRGFISWGFDPGPDRSSPPGSLQSHLEDMAMWTSAGMPCPDS